MLLGESTHSLDAKSRVVVPRRFLDELRGGEEQKTVVTLTRGFERCLFLFTEEAFASALERMKLQAFGGEELRRMQRLFFSNAQRCSIDKAGRLLIPDKLRRVAELEQEVVLVGCADRAEIWSKKAWEAFNEEYDADFDKLDGVLLGEPSQGPPGEG